MLTMSENDNLQVANLGLYGIALAVFGAVKATTCADIVVQVRCSTLPNQP
jgi:hypothetical protein